MSDHTDLLNKIEQLAGTLRAKTFRAAAEFVLHHDNRVIIETGCYRGIKEDGQSTLILAMLAAYMQTWMVSIELEPRHIEKAMELTKAYNDIEFVQGDSVTELSRRDYRPILVYLDSYDHDPNQPGPCQRHQLAEVGAIYGQLRSPCAILLDDNDLKSGGKTALAKAFLKERGWKTVMEAYQILLVKE